MNAITVTASTFDEEVMGATEPVLIDFYADWCGPCHVMEPVVQELMNEFSGRVKLVKVDVDEAGDLASRFHVHSIPNFVVIKNGEVKARLVGGQSKQSLRDAIARHLD